MHTAKGGEDDGKKERKLGCTKVGALPSMTLLPFVDRIKPPTFHTRVLVAIHVKFIVYVRIRNDRRTLALILHLSILEDVLVHSSLCYSLLLIYTTSEYLQNLNMSSSNAEK